MMQPEFPMAIGTMPAMSDMAVDSSVQAGIFTLDSQRWWGPSSLDVSAAAPSLAT